MKSGALRRALGLSLLYVGIFLALVLLQFSHGPGFMERVGRLTVSATMLKPPAGQTQTRPDTVRIAYPPLTMLISSTAPAQLVSADGSVKPVQTLSLQRAKDGVILQMEGGLALRCSAGQDTDTFRLSVSGLAAGTSLRLGYSLAGGARLLGDSDKTTLQTRTGSYALALDGATLNDDQGLLVFSASPGDSALFGLARIATPANNPPAQNAAAEQFIAQTPKDAASFGAEISAWRDKVWAGLSGSRFNADFISWKAADGSSSFSERAFDVYLAESLARGSYAGAFAKVRAIRDRAPDKLGYLSAPFLGGLAAKMPAFQTADLTEVKRLGQQIADKSLDLFTKERLLHFLLDRAPYSMAQDALRFAAGLDLSSLSVRQAVGLLGCLVEAKGFLKDEENPFGGYGGTADRVVAAVQKSGEGFFLVTDEDGSSDLRLSLLAGLYLIQYGSSQNKDMLVGVGQSLVEAVLGQSDAEGFTPARILVKPGLPSQKSGSIAPEDIYPLVAANPYYPHEVSFYRDIAPGVWAWTCSPNLTVSVSPGHELFKVQFPVGASHYLVFFGIKPFDNIQLYDIDYSPDAAFETYDASGYLYHKPSNALYLKMKHKKDVEDVRLSF